MSNSVIITPRPETLDEFSATLDAVLGYTSDVASAVRGYCLGRDILAVVKKGTEWRADLDREVERAYTAGIGPDQRHRLVKKQTGGVRRVIRSETVKQQNPSLWDASRVQSRKLVVNGPKSAVKLPTFRGSRVFGALERVTEMSSEANRLQKLGREVINGIAEEMGWPTTEAWETSDGWQIGSTLGPLTFSSTRLVELIGAEEAEQYRVETATAIGSYYKLAEVEMDPDSDEVAV